jgi:hypothetical protein
MRKNPDQRTVDLRAKYRAKHGDDWWQDEDIKAEYRAERREIYRSGPPSTGGRKQTTTKTSSKRSTKPKRKVTKIDPIKAMAVVLGTKSSKRASRIIVDGVSTAVPDGVSITRKDLKTRSNFTVQTDDGQKMVVSVTPSGKTTIKQYTSDGDIHFEQSFTLDEWLDGQDVIGIYLGDVMVEYGDEEDDQVVKPPKDKQAQKNAKQMDKLVEFLEKELKPPFQHFVFPSSDGSIEHISIAPVIDGSADEDISLDIHDDSIRIFMNNHPEENIQGYYSTLKGMKRDIRKFIRQAKELLESGVRESDHPDEDDFQEALSHFGRHPTGKTKKQLSSTKAKKIAKQALEDLGIEIGRWTSMYGGQGFGAKVKNSTLDGKKVKIVISMHADYWDVAFTEDKENPKGLLSEVGAVYHFYAQKEFGDLVKLMANYYLGAGDDIDYDEQEILDDQALIAAVPKKVSDAYFTIVDKLEELPDSYHNDLGLYYDHEVEGKVVIMRIKLKAITTNHKGIKGRPRLMIAVGKNIEISNTTIGDTDSKLSKEYKLSSTTAAFNHIKKWIESHLQKANPRRRKNPTYLLIVDEGKGDGEMHYLVEAKSAASAKKTFLAERFRPLGRNATIKVQQWED